MSKKMLIDAAHPEEVRVALIDQGKVEDFDFESASRKPLRGNIYLARVTRVEPSLQAAFVEYGGNRHGFLAFSEIHPDYYQIPVADREALQAAEEEEAALQAELDRLQREEDEKIADGASDDTSDAGENKDVDAVDDPDDVSFDDQDDDEELVAAPEALDVDDDESVDDAPSDDARDVDAEINAADEDTSLESDVNDSGEADATPFAAPLNIETPSLSATTSAIDDDSTDNDNTDDADSASDELVEGADAAGESDDNALNSTDADLDDQAEDGTSEDNVAAAGSEDDNAQSEDAKPKAKKEASARDALIARHKEAQRKRQRIVRGYKIQEVIKKRQILLIQVVKEERGNKGAALTTYMSLAGRYCVLMPNTSRGGGISRKIPSASDRRRLRRVVDSLDVPLGMGLIIRTAGAKRTKTEIKRDYDYLLRLWESIRTLTLKSIAPCLIYEEASLIKRAIRDLYDKDISKVMVEGEGGYREAKDFMKMLMPSHAKNVQPYKDTAPIFLKHGVENQLDGMYHPSVRLKSGGYIVIHQTEALVAIDVNSGRATRERNIEQTALKTNIEAAQEAARQFRLRDLAGLIVIDFIDMDEPKHNRMVEKKMKEALKTDRARIQSSRISMFGLMEISRQRRRSGIVDGTTQPCPTCAGAGVIRSHEMAALRILRAIEGEATSGKVGRINAKTSLDVALFVLNQKRDWLARIETAHGVNIEITGDSTKAGDQYDLEKSGTPRPKQAEAAFIRADLIDVDDAEIEADVAEDESSDDDIQSADDVTEGKERKRRRRGGRRRRRGGEDRGDERTEDRSDENTDGENVDAAEVSASDGEDTSADSSDAEMGEDGDKPKRKRRRGRRGGRRNRRRNAEQEAGSENDQQAEGSDAETSDAIEPAEEQSAEDIAAQAQDAPIEAEASPFFESVADDEPAPIDAAPSSESDAADISAEKPKRRSRKKAAAQTDDATTSDTQDNPQTAFDAAERARSEPEPVSAPEPAAASSEPIPAEAEQTTADDEPKQPPRRGWWSRAIGN